MDIIKIRKAILRGDIVWRKHALLRLNERNISQREVIEVLLKCNIMKIYSEDKPYPSALLAYRVSQRNIGVICSYSEREETIYIITAYELGRKKT